MKIQTAMLFGAAVIPAIATGVASAHGEGDVGLLLDGSTITTVLASDEAGDTADAFGASQRVFEGEFDNSGFADGPGTYTNSFGGFSAGTFIGYNNVGPLLAWDGTSFVSTTNALDQIVGPIVRTTPGTDTTTEGFRFQYLGGEYDEHPDLQLTDAGLTGVYLWSVEFFLSDASTGGSTLASSETVYLVLNYGMDEDVHEAAIEYAEGLVPAPAGCAVLALGGLAGIRRRR